MITGCPDSPPKTRFQQNLHQALTYHYSTTQSNDLQKKLGDEFFAKLYVRREEIEFLHDRATSRQLTILSGLTGTGKTTLLLKLVRELRGSGQFVHYLNLYQHRTKLKQYSQDFPKSSICMLMAETIRDRLAKNSSRDFQRLQAFELQHNAQFQRFRRRIAVRGGDPTEPRVIDHARRDPQSFPGIVVTALEIGPRT